MKNSTKSILAGTLLSAGAVAAVTGYRKKSKRDEFETLEDTDMMKSYKVDQEESVNADTDTEEEGLTQLDAAHRADWQANGFPQTHEEMEQLEKEEQQQ